MKLYYALLLFCLVGTPLFAQKIKLPVDDSGNVSYQAVEQVQGVDKKELFSRARNWFAQTYQSANSVLQVNDSESGELTGKGSFTITPTMLGMGIPTRVDHTIQVEVKDGRYRVTVNNFYVESKNNVGGPINNIKNTSRGFIDKIHQQTDEQVRGMLSSLNKAMNTKKADF